EVRLVVLHRGAGMTVDRDDGVPVGAHELSRRHRAHSDWSLPWFEEAFELELAVRNASVQEPVAAEHPVLVRRARDVRAAPAGRARHEPYRLEARLQTGTREDRRA